jgi:hypothetical protein
LAAEKRASPFGLLKIAHPRSQDKTPQAEYPRSLPERKTVRRAALRFKVIRSAARKAARRGPQVPRQAPPELKPNKRAVSI